MNAPNPSDAGFTVSMGGKTYRFDGEIARVVKRHREQYADDARGAAFLHGYILAITIMHQLVKGASNGEAKS